MPSPEFNDVEIQEYVSLRFEWNNQLAHCIVCVSDPAKIGMSAKET